MGMDTFATTTYARMNMFDADAKALDSLFCRFINLYRLDKNATHSPDILRYLHYNNLHWDCGLL